MDRDTQESIDEGVRGWLTKYSLDDGNLSLMNFDKPEEVEQWVNGVWWRIRDQFVGSGLPYDDSTIIRMMGWSFYKYIHGHPKYPELRKYLPRPVTMCEPKKETGAARTSNTSAHN
jgi:hypothetical protein